MNMTQRYLAAAGALIFSASAMAQQTIQFGGSTPRAAAPVVAAAPVPTKPPAQQWAIQVSDGTLSKALLRWANKAGVQLLYEAPQDLAAVMATYEGSFEEALDALLRDTANGAYPLHGCAYDNAIRVLHTTQACQKR